MQPYLEKSSYYNIVISIDAVCRFLVVPLTVRLSWFEVWATEEPACNPNFEIGETLSHQGNKCITLYLKEAVMYLGHLLI